MLPLLHCMKHNLQLKLSQQLTLTPQLQQSIRLLQLSTLELNQELEQIVQDNPLLELEDEENRYAAGSEGKTQETSTKQTEEPPEFKGEADSHQEEIDWNDYSAKSADDDDDSGPQTPAAGPSLRQYLLAQLAFIPLPERDRALVAALIDALNDDGYLSTRWRKSPKSCVSKRNFSPIWNPKNWKSPFTISSISTPRGLGPGIWASV